MNGIPSIRQSSLVAAVAFTLVLLVGYLADVVLFRHPSWILVDDVILAVRRALSCFAMSESGVVSSRRNSASFAR